MFVPWDQQITGRRGIPREYRAVQTPSFSGKSSQNLGAFQRSKQSCPQAWMSSKPFFKASFPLWLGRSWPQLSSAQLLVGLLQRHCPTKDNLMFSKLSFAEWSSCMPPLLVVSPNCYQCPRRTALGECKLPLPYGKPVLKATNRGLTGCCNHSPCAGDTHQWTEARRITVAKYADCWTSHVSLQCLVLLSGSGCWCLPNPTFQRERSPGPCGTMAIFGWGMTAGQVEDVKEGVLRHGGCPLWNLLVNLVPVLLSPHDPCVWRWGILTGF